MNSEENLKMAIAAFEYLDSQEDGVCRKSFITGYAQAMVEYDALIKAAKGKQLIIHEYNEDIAGKYVYLWVNMEEFSRPFVANWGDDEGRWFFFDRETEFFEIYNVNPTHYEII